MSNITLNERMTQALTQLINEKLNPFDDPKRSWEEQRSYATEFAFAVIMELGGEPTREQHLAWHNGDGPRPTEIQFREALTKLEEATNGK
jgi:hypothetical protein